MTTVAASRSDQPKFYLSDSNATFARLRRDDPPSVEGSAGDAAGGRPGKGVTGYRVSRPSEQNINFDRLPVALTYR